MEARDEPSHFFSFLYYFEFDGMNKKNIYQ